MQYNKLKNIEFLRFIFSLIIVFFHVVMLKSYLCQNFLTIDLYKYFTDNAGYAFFCVEFFFIISGFFLAQSNNIKEKSTSHFITGKIIRLWPTLATAIALYWIFSLFTPLEYNKYGNVLTLFFLNNIGITKIYPNIHSAWFVSVLFWVLLFYFNFIKICQNKYKNFYISLLVFITLGLTYNLSTRPIIFVLGWINFGIIRGIACVGLGYLIGTYLKDNIQRIKTCYNSLKHKIIISFLEIYLFCFLMYYLVFHKIKYTDRFGIYILAFCFLLVLCVIKKGFLSNILDNKFSECLGRYSYSIYINHVIVLDLLRAYIWIPNKEFVYTYPIFNLILPLFLTIILYHLLEILLMKYLKKKLQPETLVAVDR